METETALRFKLSGYDQELLEALRRAYPERPPTPVEAKQFLTSLVGS